MSTKVQLGKEDIRALVTQNAVIWPYFLRFLPMCKESIGLVSYSRLNRMMIEIMEEYIPGLEATYMSKAVEGAAAYEAQTPIENNPYDVDIDPVESAGWAFGWIRESKRP